MWWTITTSSTLCAASRWRCSTWSIATSCSRARRIATAGRRCSPRCRRAQPVEPWSACSPWRTIAPAKANWRSSCRQSSAPRAARPGPVAAAIRATWHGGADRHRHIAGGHNLRRPAWFPAGVAAVMSAIEVDTGPPADGFVDNASALPTTPQPLHQQQRTYNLCCFRRRRGRESLVSRRFTVALAVAGAF